MTWNSPLLVLINLHLWNSLGYFPLRWNRTKPKFSVFVWKNNDQEVQHFLNHEMIFFRVWIKYFFSYDVVKKWRFGVLCKINSTRLYIILRICFALRNDIKLNFISKCQTFKDVLSLFQKSFASCFHLGKYDFSFATQYCLISHKSLDRENKFDIFS